MAVVAVCGEPTRTYRTIAAMERVSASKNYQHPSWFAFRASWVLMKRQLIVFFIRLASFSVLQSTFMKLVGEKLRSDLANRYAVHPF